MCGIAGIYQQGIEQDKTLLEKMIGNIVHRGPDGFGFYADSDISMAHARLSIIDLEGGWQPIHNEDSRVWVVFNGEIFNYVELRAELESKGHQFYTHSDTEVIVHLYEEYGADFATYLNGQFAIAIWDKNLKRLVLVRDRVGILPLFYCENRNRVLFGSEIKAILPALDTAPALNVNALDELMTFWAPVPGNTIFDGIRALPPGNMLIVEKGEIKQRVYWDWTYPDDGDYDNASEDELCERLLEKLVDATRIRLRSDVPVGAYLSGGLDSSVLTSLIKNYTDTPLRTFSIGFSDESLDESSHQKVMVDWLGTDHSEVKCRDSMIAENFLQSIKHTELPILRSAPIPMGILSGHVREMDYRVVLTGEGSDEVFGGYDIFKESKIRRFWARNKESAWRPLLLKRLYPYLDISPGKSQAYLQNFFGVGLDNPNQVFFSHLPRWETTAKTKEFLSADTRSRLNENLDTRLEHVLTLNRNSHAFNMGQYVEAKTLMDGYLLCSQGDRMLMKNSIEGRFPFLDHHVIEFANRLKPALKMKVLNEKYLLKKTMQNLVPDAVINRHKQPYRAPDIPSFVNENTPEYVHELLSSQSLAESGYFDVKKVEFLMKKIRAGRAIGYKDNMAFMVILSTQALHQFFIKERQFS